jgi:hypothetical protein
MHSYYSYDISKDFIRSLLYENIYNDYLFVLICYFGRKLVILSLSWKLNKKFELISYINRVSTFNGFEMLKASFGLACWQLRFPSNGENRSSLALSVLEFQIHIIRFVVPNLCQISLALIIKIQSDICFL